MGNEGGGARPEYSAGMAAACVDLDERAMLEELVKQLEMPKGVRLQRVEDSSDWEGNPALRVYFNVSRRFPLDKKRVQSLSDLSSSVRKAAFSAGMKAWPFTHFLEVR